MLVALQNIYYIIIVKNHANLERARKGIIISWASLNECISASILVCCKPRLETYFLAYNQGRTQCCNNRNRWSNFKSNMGNRLKRSNSNCSTQQLHPDTRIKHIFHSLWLVTYLSWRDHSSKFWIVFERTKYNFRSIWLPGISSIVFWSISMCWRSF